ncbi:T9SS type A sorting domain-containing protein [Pedobacter sp. SD-b]|uniref:T9SS type A sorting domain-containing protein n=1 Tax=Pedobacter segetis TaxID=2793069 RepID=A0ABS1BL45_9SPHI|nr:T9SS type A sorting domain-containing protein [Pedobacter segetis]MBK0383608.1 T9SS type A sorting domain-containing protein [Pedobacter segetis]
MKKKLLFIALAFLAKSSFGQVIGDYRTVASATDIDWKNGVAASWEVYNGTAWVAATEYPSATTTPVPTTITIVAPTTVGRILRVATNATQANLPNTNLVVEDGAILQMGYNQRFGYALIIKNLTINPGGTFTVSTTGELSATAATNQPIRTQDVRINGSLTVISGNGTVNNNPAKFIGTYTYSNAPTTVAPESSYTQRFIGYIGTNGQGNTYPPASANVVYPAASENFTTVPAPGTSTNATWVFNGTVLPLDLVSFKASLNLNNAVLKWTTANEVNVSRFEVEKSIDGNVFSSFKSVPAKNTAELHNYSVNDENVNTGFTYYRLKMIDNDGQFKYSEIQSINNKNINISVYPNPANDLLKVQFPLIAKNGEIKVFNMNGSLISKVNLLKQSNFTEIDVSKLAYGIYTLSIEIDGQKLEKKFNKQ